MMIGVNIWTGVLVGEHRVPLSAPGGHEGMLFRRESDSVLMSGNLEAHASNRKHVGDCDNPLA